MSVQGNWMPCDLSDPSGLTRSSALSSRPSDELLRLSYELSSTAYDFDIQRWYAAGWRDFSFRINEKLLTGTDINLEKSSLTKTVKTGYYQIRARQSIRFASPLAQYRGTGSGSDHAKAVFMMMPHGDRYVVGIGFTGTCRRVDDWLPNLLMDEKDGMHAGFLRLSREIWRACPQISFPSCARALGLDSLTLSDIISECRREDSRFLIWMSGHSQGGAVMQLFTRYLCSRGVLPGNMIGCAFAAPSVLWQNESCPVRLYLVMNSDDLIPRFGARFHYGRLWMADMDDLLRKLCYSSDADDPCFRTVLDLSHQIRTTEDALLVTCCLLEAVRDKDMIRAPQFLSSMLSYLKIDPIQKMEEKLDLMTDRVRARALRYYRAFSGREDLEPVRYAGVMSAIKETMLRFGDAEFTRCVKNVLAFPHRIRNNESARLTSPYCLICQKDETPFRYVSDSDLEIRPARRYTGSIQTIRGLDTRRPHLKQRRFRFGRLNQTGR